MDLRLLLFTFFISSFAATSQYWDSLKYAKRNFEGKNTWSISTNLTSLYRPKRVAFSKENKFTTTNPYLTFEPEILVRKRLSLKFPIAIGLVHLKNRYEENNTRNSSYFYSYPQGYPGEAPYFSENYTPYNAYYHGTPTFPYKRYNDLIIQIGFYPKIYPFGKGKTTFYLSPGINFGAMDKYKIVYYHDFVKVDQKYQIVHERMVYYRDPFLFIRKEFLLGLDISFTKSFNISLESGIASMVNGYGLNPDIVNQKLGDAPYETIYKDYTKNDVLPEERRKGYLILRFLVQYNIPHK